MLINPYIFGINRESICAKPEGATPSRQCVRTVNSEKFCINATRLPVSTAFCLFTGLVPFSSDALLLIRPGLMRERRHCSGYILFSLYQVMFFIASGKLFFCEDRSLCDDQSVLCCRTIRQTRYVKETSQFNKIRLEIQLTVDASGYTWEGLRDNKKTREEERRVKTSSHRFAVFPKGLNPISFCCHFTTV